MSNFTVVDLVQTTLATFGFALFLLPSGYLFGLASDVFKMRSRSPSEKLLFSIGLSTAVTPIIAVLAIRASSFQVTLSFFLLFAATAIATFVRQFSLPAEFSFHLRRSTWLILCMLLAWFLVVQFSLADLQIGHRLYVSYTAYDHSVRVPFVEAAARTGVPPLNPFYGLGKIPVLRYYYYWYVVCALPMRLLGVSARACLNASVFWSGLGLASMVPLFLKYVLGEKESVRTKSVIGIALLAVTGLDLIPYAAMASSLHALPGDMEWWDTNQVSSWLGSLLWVPHHVAALTACMVALLVLSAVDEESTLRQRFWAAGLAGLALASAAGLSVYVTFTFAVFAILWAVQLLIQGRLKTLATFVSAGTISLLFSWPYLSDLLSKRSEGYLIAGGDRFAYVAFRDFPVALRLLEKLGIHNHSLLSLSQLPILVVVYILEFGVFALIVLLRFRRDLQSSFALNRQHRILWTMFVVCLVAMSVVQSDSTGSNDLGFRGMLVVQFVLLIWSAPIIHDMFLNKRIGIRLGIGARWTTVSVIFALALGVAGTVCQLVALRCYAPLVDAGKTRRTERFLGSPGFAERTYWLREGFDRLNGLVVSSATVQFNPVNDETLIVHLYSTRQAAMGDQNCFSAFGGSLQKCRLAYPYVAALFNTPETVRDWDINALCDEFHVNVLVATDVDPIWQDSYGWVWTRPALLANPAMRAIPCGTTS